MNKAKWLFMFLLALTMAAPTFAVELTLGGFPSYMRTRARYIGNATFISALSNSNAQALGFTNNKDEIFFVDTSLRLTPQLVLSDAVTIRAQFNVFDNNIWGGATSELLGGQNTVVNSNISFSDRFRGAILTGPRAIDDPGFFNVRMLHADIVLPHNLGFVRVGRQPFDWGLGMYLNGGWDPYSDLGTLFDRFLYLKSFSAGSSSITLVLLSDILTQGNSVVTGQGNGYDIIAGALIFNNPNIVGGNLTIGGFIFPYIHQNNINSVPLSGTDPGVPPNAGAAVSGLDLDHMVLYSGLIDYKTDLFRIVGELDGVWGKLHADGVGDIDIDASNIVFAARAEVYPGWPLKIVAAEFGWAKGDDLSSGSVEGGLVYFNPAYNLDNLLFKHMIPNIYQVESSVYNAYYARAWGTVKLIDELSFTPQVLVAFNEETSNPYPGVSSLDTYMATEVEGTLTWHVHPGVSFDVIGGIVFAGSSLETLLEAQAMNTLVANDVTPDRVNYNDTPWTVQGRLMIFIDQFFK
ncbi:MAG TPA: hypothetical protein PKC29_04370 [Thermodesulfobacteriota bacterium]|nr:hypothetical protein [Thermodesulfobacteriota bacterium]